MPSSLLLLLVTIIGSVSGCQNGYEPWFAGNCFKMFEWGMKFSEAKMTCENYDGALSSIHSDKENEATGHQVQLSGWPVWIGLRCNATTGGYFWIDGSTVEYLNIESPPSDRNCKDSNSGFILVPGGKWRAVPSASIYPALCRHDGQNSAVCDDYDQVAGSATCVSLRTETSSWEDAEKTCMQEDAHLVSIHDGYVANYIAQKALEAGATALHIGMRTNAGDWQWTDGSSVNLTNWMLGFPSDTFGHCTAMETRDVKGQWMSTHCTSSGLPFVCGRPAFDINNPFSPAGCPQNSHYSSETKIYSPSYPGGSGNITCEYFVVAPKGKQIKVTLDDLEVNKSSDVLEAYDGSSGILLEGWTGQSAPGSLAHALSSSNQLRLLYTATDGTNVRGWKAQIAFV